MQQHSSQNILLSRVFILAAFASFFAAKQAKEKARIFRYELLKCIGNNDTVSNSFIWFHSKNETTNREVKLSFGIETMLISLSNCNLSNKSSKTA